jgi:hypothetical protein
MRSRVAGVGRVLLGSQGTLELSYAWGLNLITNNQVEAYTLLQGVLSSLKMIM